MAERQTTAWRRLVLDMHIGDWDEGFLAAIDPTALADACERGRMQSVMVYCLSHVGLCYWPTPHGRHHAGLKGRDLVGEFTRELNARGIDACGYVSVIFDNWAFLEHPEWRQQPVQIDLSQSSDELFAGGRYGLVCPNNPDYRRYILAQVDDLYGRYPFATAFYDMTFWPTVCQCPTCRQRFRDEHGGEIPSVVDWLDPTWCSFQAAREAWLVEFAQLLTDRTKAVRPGIPVYHNAAVILHGSRRGVPAAVAAANDFMGADLYGDAAQQLLGCKLYERLSANPPLEFMSTRCPTPSYHEQIRSAADMERLVLGATSCSAAFTWIDAVNVDGTVNPAVYERMADVFSTSIPYEPYLGGEPVEDIAIYFSDASRVDFRENGKPLTEVQNKSEILPHLRAANGWARVLQRAHIPFGVITRKDLDSLSHWHALILPNVLRMDKEEVAAVRDYVRRGGRLYASRYTSLTQTGGVRSDDFMLADVFGCHFAADDLGTSTYLKPVATEVSDAIAPQAYLDHFAPPGSAADGAGSLRLADDAAGEVLATLTLPYANEWGDMFNRKWASIHSSPPWRDTVAPAVVRNAYGEGVCIYSATDIESIFAEVNDAVLRRLLTTLVDRPIRCGAEAPAWVWLTVRHRPEACQYTISLFNCQAESPPTPLTTLPVFLRVPADQRVSGVCVLPDREPMPFVTDSDNTLRLTVDRLATFHMLVVSYEGASL